VSALLSQATTDGYTAASGTTLKALDTYVKGLKNADIWDKLDVLYVFATNGDSDFATYNLKDPTAFQATKVNSPTFTTDEGFTGDGVSAYLDTNFNLATDGVNYSQNSASLGAYSRNILSSSDSDALIGASPSIIFNASIGRYQVAINGGSSLLQTIETEENGFIMGTRVSSSEIRVYNNSNELVNSSSTSQAPENLTLRVLSRNVGLESDAQVSIVFAGGDLSAEASDFFDIIETYMDALGKGVVS
jgi:hypothetical protein